jgi:hypothetical protein
MTMCVVSAALAAAATELFTRIFVNHVHLLHPSHADIVIEGSRGLGWTAEVYGAGQRVQRVGPQATPC